MNQNIDLLLSLREMPLVLIADHLSVTEPFLHANRTAPFHVLIFVISGMISVVEEGQEYVIHAKECLFLKQGIHHYGVKPSSPSCEWIYVHFHLSQPFDAKSTAFGDHEEHVISQKPFSPYLSHVQEQIFTTQDYNYTILIPKYFSLKEEYLLERKLYRFVELFHSSDPFRAALLSPLFYEFLVEIHRTFFAVVTKHGTKTVHQIIQYLEAHTHENFSTAKLSTDFCLSYKHLAKMFKQETQMSMLTYHTNLRMHEAAKLLRESTLSIHEIASFMGYEDAFYFSNIFHKTQKLSPKEYRKKYQ